MEYKALLSMLIDEWKPSGLMQHDAVCTIASCMWRKKRVPHYIRASMAARMVDPKSNGYDEKYALTAALSLIEANPEYIANALQACRPWMRERIEAKYQHSNYATRSEWNAAVRDDLTSMLRSELERDKAGEETPWCWTIKASAVFEDGLFTTEIAMLDSLDAMIDRAIKRLGH
jgi:hypothetical protein